MGPSLFAAVCATGPASPVVLLSPFSIAGALSLAAAGASAEAEAELLKLLGVRNFEAFGAFALSVLPQQPGDGVTLRVANSVWSKQSIKSTYIERIKRAGALAAPLDVSYAPVNEWVKVQTEGHITDLLEGAPDPLVKAVLVNRERRLLQRELGEPVSRGGHGGRELFDASAGPTAQFMHQRAKIELARAVGSMGGATVARLDYGTREGVKSYCALFVLPAELGPASMDEAVRGLRSTNLAELLSGMRTTDTKLSLPKFKAEWGASSLKPLLRTLGVSASFDGSGQFLGMSDDPELHIDDVIHKALLEVNEEGTVAAAATAVVMKSRSMPRPPLELSFNRPFLMLLLHASTATPLFLGRFNQPEFTP